MFEFKKNNSGGFIKMIIILIVVIATLSYFKIDVKSVIKSEPVQAIWSFSKTVFTNYIEPSTEYVWNNVLKEFIFKNVTNFFTKANKQISTTNIKDITNSASSSPDIK